MRLPAGKTTIDVPSSVEPTNALIISYFWYNLKRWSTDSNIKEPLFISTSEGVNRLLTDPDTVLWNKGKSDELASGLESFLIEIGAYPIMGNLTYFEIIDFSSDVVLQNYIAKVLDDFQLSINQFWPVAESLILQQRFRSKLGKHYEKLKLSSKNLVRVETRDTAFRSTRYWWIDPKLSILSQPEKSLVMIDLGVSCESDYEPLVDRFLKHQGSQPGSPLYLILDDGWFSSVNLIKSKPDNRIKMDEYLEYLGFEPIGSSLNVRRYFEQVYDRVHGKSSFVSSAFSRLFVTLLE